MTVQKAAVKFSAVIEALYMDDRTDAAIESALALPPGTVHLWRALNRCPPNEFIPPLAPRRCRTDVPALLLLHAAGCPDTAIAAALGVTTGTVRYHRHRLSIPANYPRGRPRVPRTTTR